MRKYKEKMKNLLLIILFLQSVYGYSQEYKTMKIWNKNGSSYLFRTENIDSITFPKIIDMRNWDDIITIPSQDDIYKINNRSKCKSPYLTAVLHSNTEDAFSQYSIDFKADYLPIETYWCLNCFDLDYESLLKKYVKVDNGGHHSGYAGLQRSSHPDLSGYNGILSLWDTYCVDKSGKVDTIKAKLIASYNGTESIRYEHEGQGISCMPKYDWKPGKWYRFLMQCINTPSNDNTEMWLWVGDIEAGKWTILCKFDLGAPNLNFKGNPYIFLENWQKSSAGEIRSLEFKNAKIYSPKDYKWLNIYSGYFTDRADDENRCYSGSYSFGSDDTTFWMITTGVPDCADDLEPKILNVNYVEDKNPTTLHYLSPG